MRNMNWMMAVALLSGSAVAMGAQSGPTVKDDLFAGTEKFAANASSVTEVDMDPNSLGMVNGSNASRARRTILSVVHTYSYDKPGMYNMADVDAFRAKLNQGDWHCSVHTREMKTGESTDVCQKHRTDDLLESAIITVEPKELTFIHTIRRPGSPSAPGAPGAPPAPGRPSYPESYLIMPGGDFSYAEGVPSATWAAELRANAAEMRAQAAASRAEMAAMQPEMMGDMAELRAKLMPLITLSGMDGMSVLNDQWVNGLREKLKAMPALPAMPVMPVMPAMPVIPAVPATPLQ